MSDQPRPTPRTEAARNAHAQFVREQQEATMRGSHYEGKIPPDGWTVSERLEREADARAERIEKARIELCSVGLLPSYFDTLEKAVEGAKRIISGLRSHIENPPVDIQEAVLKKLGIWEDAKPLLDQIAQLESENAKLREALERIKNGEDAPDIDIGGEEQFGLHCGVEDRSCSDRYEGADYGYSRGVERGLEWAVNEATAALAGKEEG